MTFYDPLGLVKPQSAVYTHDARPDLEEAGVRIRNWQCESSSNSYKDKDGNTQFYLPGDPEYKDPRGFTDFPDIPGQSLNPIFDGEKARNSVKQEYIMRKQIFAAAALALAILAERQRRRASLVRDVRPIAVQARRGDGHRVELQQSAQLAAHRRTRSRMAS